MVCTNTQVLVPVPTLELPSLGGDWWSRGLVSFFVGGLLCVVVVGGGGELRGMLQIPWSSLFSESGSRNVVVFDSLSSQGQDTVNTVFCVKRKETLSWTLSDE